MDHLDSWFNLTGTSFSGGFFFLGFDSAQSLTNILRVDSAQSMVLLLEPQSEHSHDVLVSVDPPAVLLTSSVLFTLETVADENIALHYFPGELKYTSMYSTNVTNSASLTKYTSTFMSVCHKISILTRLSS